MSLFRFLVVFASLSTVFCRQAEIFEIKPQVLTVLVGEQAEITVKVLEYLLPNQGISFEYEEGKHFNITPVLSNENSGSTFNFILTGISPGRFTVIGDVNPRQNSTNLFILLKVAKSRWLIYFSVIVGWAYFACWSIGYYPQIYINYKRKSVIGLSFDFLWINIVGHACYAVFNSALFWNDFIEREYFRRHPYGLNPVIGNDVGFALHAVFATGLTIAQCFIYEAGDQNVSMIAKSIIGSFFGVMIAAAGLVGICKIHILDFLYVLSYLKLTSTLIKYFPQAFMNYKRKSTIGFSIENRLLDIAGGVLGILQMIINAYNFDDWQSFTGDPVKLGLGIFSILFDCVFIVQHYFLYSKKHTKVTFKDVKIREVLLEH